MNVSVIIRYAQSLKTKKTEFAKLHMGEKSVSPNLTLFLLSYSGHLVFLLPKTFKLLSFQSSRNVSVLSDMTSKIWAKSCAMRKLHLQLKWRIKLTVWRAVRWTVFLSQVLVLLLQMFSPIMEHHRKVFIRNFSTNEND
jgi:hypothetical protein